MRYKYVSKTTQIRTNLLDKGLNFSITWKTLPDKDNITNIKDLVKNLE